MTTTRSLIVASSLMIALNCGPGTAIESDVDVDSDFDARRTAPDALEPDIALNDGPAVDSAVQPDEKPIPDPDAEQVESPADAGATSVDAGSHLPRFARLWQSSPSGYLGETICAMDFDGVSSCWSGHAETPVLGVVGTYPDVVYGCARVGCAIEGGRVSCWSTAAAEVTAVPAEGDFVDVITDGLRACAQRRDKTWACWGRATDAPPIPPEPIESMCLGWAMDCYARPDFSAFCVSDWADLQLTLGPGSVKSFACTQGSSVTLCWIDSHDHVVCNGYVGNPMPGSTPLGTELRVVRLVGAWGNFCALSVEGRLHCWGANFQPDLLPEDPQSQWPQPPNGRYSDLVSLAEGFCALAEDGTIHCWGFPVINDWVRQAARPGSAPG